MLRMTMSRDTLSRRIVPLGVLCVIGAVQLAHSQSPAPDRRFAAATGAVSVDVVVRDRQGRPVVDLGPTDFEVYEDGVRQEIGAFRLVAAGQPAAPAQESRRERETANGGAVGPATFKAIVFDRLSPDARALASKGALASLDQRNDDFVGVFLSDLRLETIQTYTNDPTRIRRAIQEAGARASSSFGRDGVRVGTTARGDGNAGVSSTASAEFQGPAHGRSPEQPPAVRGGDPSTRLIQEMTARMDRAYELLIRDQQGLATTNALLAVIEGLAQLPGRKTVVFLAEGLALPPRVMARFESVVASANRANVTVYAIDAAGLRAHSSTAETARNIQALGARSLGEAPRLDSSAWSQDLEINEDVLRQDPAVSLRMLAERTGGVLINNTNDLEQGLRQVDADARAYYVLDYVPKNPAFRGEWRAISIKVPSRRNITVRSRSGYLAVHEPGVLPLLSFEGPAHAALAASPLPTALPVRAGVWSFPMPSGETRVAVLAATDLSAQTFAQDDRNYRTDFTLLMRIRNAAGEIVRKASQPYRLTGPVGQLAHARRGDVLLFRQITLEAGEYTIEYAVYDALAGQSGAASQPFTVHRRTANGLGLGDLLIVQKTERQPVREGEPPNLLRHDDLLLYPNLGEPISKRVTSTISFFFVVTPVAGTAPPVASLQLLKMGEPMGEAPLSLAAPGADGGIRHAGQLPLANFPPGRFELRIVVTQGDERQVRTAVFEVIE